MQKYILILFLIFSVFSANAQAFEFQDDIFERTIRNLNLMENNDSTASDLLCIAKKYIGTHYRTSGKTPQGFDCSGFVGYVFREFGIELPASSRDMATIGDPVDKKDLKRGDLVFFEGNAHNKRIGHVGIVSDVNNQGVFFIHASTQSNVTISNIDKEFYYSTRFLKAKRVSLDKSPSIPYTRNTAEAL
jgi:hypothetical protein